MAATMAPGLRAFTSSAEGRRTLSRMSAPRSASAALAAMVGALRPCSASSEKRERAPAPACTFTVQPSAVSFFTVSGDTATRGSPSRSAVTAIVTMDGSPRHGGARAAARSCRISGARAA